MDELLGVGRVVEIPLDLIDANPRQPRQNFDEVNLAELRNSIMQVGVLQPISVRQVDQRFEIVMGERRARASKLAGLATIPAVVRPVGDEEMLRRALLENIQRAELNAIEEATAYRQMLDEQDLTHEELASLVGKSRSHVTHLLRLLDLPAEVQRRVAAGVLSAGHGKVLTGVREPGACLTLARRIVAENLSVRATEELVQLGNLPGVEPDPPKRRRNPVIPLADQEVLSATVTLESLLDTRVRIQAGRVKGRIVIEFGGRGDLSRVVAALRQGESRH